MKHILSLALLTTVALAWPVCGQAPATAAPPVPETKAKVEKRTPAGARKPATFPFRGTLKAVDKDAMTLTLAGKEKDRVIHITSQTRFIRDGKPATLNDAILDGEVAGSARKTDDGRTEAVSVRFGPAPGKSSKPAKKPKSSEVK